MTYNAADRRQVKAAARYAKADDLARHETVTLIMSTTAGRLWMLTQLERCHVFAGSFTGNGLTMAFAEGERNIGLQFINDIMATCPDEYVTMMRERNARDAARSTLSEQPGISDRDGRDQGSNPDSFDPGDARVEREDA